MCFPQRCTHHLKTTESRWYKTNPFLQKMMRTVETKAAKINSIRIICWWGTLFTTISSPLITLLDICTYIYSLKFIQTSFINSNTWRAKSLDGHDRSSSSSSINSNPAKHGYHQPTNNCKTNLRDLQKPLTIHVDYQLPGSVSSGPRSHRTISSAHTNTSLSNGARDTCASLHVPSSNVIKSNIICPHGQRRLSKR